MAARGSESKEIIISKILNTFEGAFKYDKEIRIPMIEGGEEIQIKVTLTAAKTNVEHGGDVAVPGAKPITQTASSAQVSATTEVATEPSEEEKKNLEKLIASLF